MVPSLYKCGGQWAVEGMMMVGLSFYMGCATNGILTSRLRPRTFCPRGRVGTGGCFQVWYLLATWPFLLITIGLMF